MKKPTLRFGPGGVPLSTIQIKDDSGKKLDLRNSAIYQLTELNLNHMEVEFVHGVRIAEDNARALGELAQRHDISLTVHGPYYINLASKERPKYHASIHRVQKTIQAAVWLNATSLTFHPAFYQGRDPEEVTEIVRDALLDAVTDEKFVKKLPANTDIPLISLETTGKPSQWGSLAEILNLAKDLNRELKEPIFSACIDFAHIHARSNGAYNSKDEFNEIIAMTEEALGTSALKHLHMHISGINYSHKGERNHLVLEKSDIKWRELLEVLYERKVSGWVVCESPNLEEDAALMKEYYESL